MEKAAFKKKLENFWYYYKVHVIVAIIAILVVGVLVKQCAETVDPDMTVLIVSTTVSLTEDQQTSIENMLNKYTEDVNGDGRKVVDVETFYLGDSQDPQMKYALMQKLMAEIAATDDSIFLTDDSYYDQLTQNERKFFYKLDKVYPGGPETDRVEVSKLPDFNLSGLDENFRKLTVSLRSFGDESPSSDSSGSVKNSINVLKKLLQNAGLLK